MSTAFPKIENKNEQRDTESKCSNCQFCTCLEALHKTLELKTLNQEK